MYLSHFLGGHKQKAKFGFENFGSGYSQRNVKMEDPNEML